MNNNPYSSTIQEAALILHDANEKIKELLGAIPDLQTLAFNTYNRIAQIEQSLYGIGGLPSVATINVEQNLFKPLKEIMGIPIGGRKPVTNDDMQPTETEKDRFLKRVEEYYKQVPELQDDKVLHVLRTPQGESILRGVAKRAGVENWRNAKLDIEFVSAIKQGIADKREVEEAESKGMTAAASATSEKIDKALSPWAKKLPEQQFEQQPSTGAQNAETETDITKLQLNPLQDTVRAPHELTEQQRLELTSEREKAEEQNEQQAVKEANANQEESKTTEETVSEDKAALIARAKELKVAGRTVRQIADELNISTGTASNYINAK